MTTLRTLVPSSAHPLAAVAARNCANHPPASRVGSVACGPCWRLALDTDAAFAADCELPAAIPAHDPELLDEVAVRIAMAGIRRVRLSHAEWAEVVRRIRALNRWTARTVIADRLRLVDLPAALPVAVAA